MEKIFFTLSFVSTMPVHEKSLACARTHKQIETETHTERKREEEKERESERNKHEPRSTPFRSYGVRRSFCSFNHTTLQLLTFLLVLLLLSLPLLLLSLLLPSLFLRVNYHDFIFDLSSCIGHQWNALATLWHSVCI